MEKTIEEKYIAFLEDKIRHLKILTSKPMTFTFMGYSEKQLEEIVKKHENSIPGVR